MDTLNLEEGHSGDFKAPSTSSDDSSSNLVFKTSVSEDNLDVASVLPFHLSYM